MVKTEYICNLCESSAPERNAERVMLAFRLPDELTQPFDYKVHVCLNCLRGLEKALKANWIQKLLGSSEDALDAVLEGNEIWQTWRNDSDRIAWARGKDYLHLWNDAKHTANSLIKLTKDELGMEGYIFSDKDNQQVNKAWFEKVTQKLKEDLQEKAA